jgi:hypothetical protein
MQAFENVLADGKELVLSLANDFKIGGISFQKIDPKSIFGIVTLFDREQSKLNEEYDILRVLLLSELERE